jgi:excisionase family DNA binding protein
MATAMAPETVVAAKAGEQSKLRTLDERLTEIEARNQSARLIGPNGEEIAIPASAFHALRFVVEGMSRGLSVHLVPQGKELTTKQAAELLHVSRPFLVRNLLGKEIAFEKVGTHRRVRLTDLLAYRERRAQERRRLIDDMTRAAQDLPGGYR